MNSPLRFCDGIFDFGNALTILGFLFLAAMFLTRSPRKDYFFLRLGLSSLLILALSVFVPHIPGLVDNGLQAWTFFRFTFFVFLSALPIYFSFRITLTSTITVASTGYMLQHLCSRIASIIRNNSTFLDGLPATTRYHVIMLILIIPVAIAALFSVGHVARKSEFYKNNNVPIALLSMGLVVLCVLAQRFESTMDIVSHVYVIALCIIGVVSQYFFHLAFRSAQDKAILETMLREEQQQYEASRAAIELINIKCHDLKHQLSVLEGKVDGQEIARINDTIAEFDANFRSENKALDIVLSQKSYLALNLGVKLTCFGNGKAISFMEDTDVYSLFGNALDNALEASEKVEDKQKRSISLTIDERQGMVVISVLNYFNTAFTPNVAHPRTTKGDEAYHGFGLRSIKYIASKYGGDASISIDGEIFSLTVYLCPKAK